MGHILLGTDPEVCIVNKKTGEPVPAHLFFPDKHHKLASKDTDEWDELVEGQRTTGTGLFKLFRDGYMVEVNTFPSHCRGLLFEDLRFAFKRIRDIIGPEHTIASAPTVKIDLKQMATAPRDCKEFGCDPSLDAYANGAPKIPQLDAMTHRFRYAGGHMHFSVDKLMAERGELPAGITDLARPAEYPRLAKLLDLFVGVPLAVIFGGGETWARREFYGQAGEYRAQDYGETSERGRFNFDAPRDKKTGQHVRYPDIKKHFVGLEYRTPDPQMFNNHAIASLFFGVARQVLTNSWVLRDAIKDAKMEAAVRLAVNTGVGASKLLQTVPGFYDPDIIKVLATKRKHFGLEEFTFDSWTRSMQEGWGEWATYNKVPMPKWDDGKYHDEGDY